MDQLVTLEAKDQLAWFDCTCRIRFEDTPSLRGTPGVPNPYLDEHDDFVRQMMQHENRRAIGPRKIQLLPEGVREEVAGFSFTSKWTDLDYWIRTEEHLFIVHPTLNAHVIPRRSFPTQEQEGAFIAFLNSHLKERSLKH